MSEKSLEMRHFRVFTYPEEPELAPSWAAGVARSGKDERTGSSGGGWVYNEWRPGGQNGNAGLAEAGLGLQDVVKAGIFSTNYVGFPGHLGRQEQIFRWE